MIETLIKVLTVAFLGFFPLFEVFVAIPAGVGMGLNYLGVFLASVAGNFLPVFFIELAYEKMSHFRGFYKWLNREPSEGLQNNLNRYGFWYILFITPWTGVWLMAIAARLLKMPRKVLWWGTLSSLIIYGLAILALIQLGVDIFG